MKLKMITGVLLFSSILIMTFNVSLTSALSLSATLEEIGDGKAEWTREVAHSGSYSVKLTIPDGATSSTWAIIKVSYGTTLSTLGQYSSYLYSNAKHHPRFAIYLDKTGDGRVDNLLLSDYLELEGGKWTVGTGGLRWGWTETPYPPYKYGEPWQPYDYWQSLYGDATVLNVAVVLEYWAVEPDALGEPLYVDDIIINEITYDLEPEPEDAKALLEDLKAEVEELPNEAFIKYDPTEPDTLGDIEDIKGDFADKSDNVIENIVDEDPNYNKALEKLEELKDMLYEQITEPYRGDLLDKIDLIRSILETL